MIKIESADTSIFDEVSGFFATQAEELGIPLKNVSRAQYYGAFINHHISIYTVRDDGSIVGYAVMWLFKDTKTKMQEAMNDTLYLVPAYRGRNIALRLVKFIESDLRERGVEKIYFGFRSRHDQARLMGFLGYEESDIIYSKILGD